jgi:hypothetical protein
MGVFNRIINEDGKETKTDGGEVLADAQAFPTLEEFEAADESVSKLDNSSSVDNFRSDKARGGIRRFRKRKADAEADAIMAERDERDAPFVTVPSDSVMKDTKASENKAKVNFSKLKRSQRKARKSEPSVIGDRKTEGRDLEQDRQRQAEKIYTDYDKWKDEKDESDLLGWDTKRDRIF